MRRDPRRDPHPVEFDRVLITRLDRCQVIGVRPVGDLKPPDVVGRIGIGARHLQRVFVLLNDKIVIAQIVDRRDVWREGDAVAGDGSVALRNEPRRSSSMSSYCARRT
jgi:hypothetical protein